MLAHQGDLQWSNLHIHRKGGGFFSEVITDSHHIRQAEKLSEIIWKSQEGYWRYRNVRTFVTSLIKVCYNLLQIRHHPNDVFSFFLNHTTEGHTLNLPESFSQVANNLINEEENELCGDSGYYQDGLPDTCQSKGVHTHPPWQEGECPFTLSFVLGYYTIVNVRIMP